MNSPALSAYSAMKAYLLGKCRSKTTFPVEQPFRSPSGKFARESPGITKILVLTMLSVCHCDAVSIVVFSGS